MERYKGMIDECAADGEWVRYADAQATVEALQAVIKQMGEQACVLAKDGMAAKAQVEALQRERDHAKKMEVMQKEIADNQTWHVRELRTALDAEREKVAFLEKKNANLVEASNLVLKVKADQDERIDELQSQLSQLQALVRALKGDANYTYHVADNPDEDDQYTVYVHVNGQGYGAIAEFYSRNEALAYAEIKRVATLPATPTGEAT